MINLILIILITLLPRIAIIAGLSATTITHPFDMLKTRVQLKPQNYPNIWLGALKIFKVQ
jgi:hypothetical protein